MKRVFVIHGWGGSSQKDWIPWVREQLQQKGYTAIAPDMPDTDVPVIRVWVDELARLVGTPDKDTYFIGHSIGCQTILRYLETINTPVGGAVFVAGWFNLENLENEEVEQIAAPWITTPIDLKKVAVVLPQSTLLISDNDCYGAFEYNKEKFTELGSKIQVLHDAGHITGEEGFTSFENAVTELEALSK